MIPLIPFIILFLLLFFVILPVIIGILILNGLINFTLDNSQYLVLAMVLAYLILNKGDKKWMID